MSWILLSGEKIIFLFCVLLIVGKRSIEFLFFLSFLRKDNNWIWCYYYLQASLFRGFIEWDKALFLSIMYDITDYKLWFDDVTTVFFRNQNIIAFLNLTLKDDTSKYYSRYRLLPWANNYKSKYQRWCARSCTADRQKSEESLHLHSMRRTSTIIDTIFSIT